MLSKRQIREIHEELLNDHPQVGGTTDVIISTPDDDLAGEEGGLLLSFSGDLDVDYSTVDEVAREMEKELAGLNVEFSRSYDEIDRDDPITNEPTDGPYIEILTESLD